MNEVIETKGAYLEVDRLLALDEADEVDRHNAPLVDELVEGVLPVGSRLAKVDLSGLEGQLLAVHAHALAVALHRHLQVCNRYSSV